MFLIFKSRKNKKASVSTWIWVVGGIIIGVFIFTLAYSQLIGVGKTIKDQRVREEFIELGNRVNDLCFSVPNNVRTYTMIFNENVNLTYLTNDSSKIPTNRIEKIKNENISQGNILCIIFRGRKPKCRKLECEAKMPYIGAIPPEESLWAIVNTLLGGRPEYRYDLILVRRRNLVEIGKEKPTTTVLSTTSTTSSTSTMSSTTSITTTSTSTIFTTTSSTTISTTSSIFTSTTSTTFTTSSSTSSISTTTSSTTSTSTTSTTSSSTSSTSTSSTTSTTSSTTTTVISKNEKDMSKYTSKEAFLITDREFDKGGLFCIGSSWDGENWKKILPLVPVSIWTHSGIKKHPLLVAHKDSYDPVLHFFRQYDPSRITVIGDIPCKLRNKLNAQGHSLQKISVNDYFSYWKSFGSVVYVEKDYEKALIASTYASLINAPLIIKGTALDTNNILNNKNVVCVGLSGGKCDKTYSLQHLQKKYLQKTSTDKVVLANPKDLNLEFDGAFKRQSLVAPILASGKHELIITTPVGGSPPNANGCKKNSKVMENINKVDDMFTNKMNSLGVNPYYLTIVASPKSIPDSYVTGCYQQVWQERDEADWTIYGDDYMRTGRIYTPSTSGLSAYVARSLFYNELVNKLYGNQYRGMSIGHSFSYSEKNAQTIKEKTSQAGYDSICFTGTKVPTCIQCNCERSPDVSYYKSRQFITFSDHGRPTEWYLTISSSDLPELKLTYSWGMACSTNGFWEGGKGTFGPVFLKKGGIGYHGSVGVTYSSNNDLEAIKFLTSEDNTLGEVLYDEDVLTQLNDWILLGDPTLKLKVKHVNW